MSREKKLSYSAIDTQINNLRGKVLTIIDASIADKEQRKAIKDLIHSIFSRKLDWIYQTSTYPFIEFKMFDDEKIDEQKEKHKAYINDGYELVEQRQDEDGLIVRKYE